MFLNFCIFFTVSFNLFFESFENRRFRDRVSGQNFFSDISPKLYAVCLPTSLVAFLNGLLITVKVDVANGRHARFSKLVVYFRLKTIYFFIVLIIMFNWNIILLMWFLSLVTATQTIYACMWQRVAEEFRIKYTLEIKWQGMWLNLKYWKREVINFLLSCGVTLKTYYAYCNLEEGNTVNFNAIVMWDVLHTRQACTANKNCKCFPKHSLIKMIVVILYWKVFAKYEHVTLHFFIKCFKFVSQKKVFVDVFLFLQNTLCGWMNKKYFLRCF